MPLRRIEIDEVNMYKNGKITECYRHMQHTPIAKRLSREFLSPRLMECSGLYL